MKLENEIHMTRFVSNKQRTWLNLLVTASRSNMEMTDIFRKWELTSQQYNVLRILRGLYPEAANLCNIQQKMIEKSSNATRLVEKLRRKGLVVRKTCAENRRKVNIKITDRGLKRLTDMDHEVEDAINRLFIHLNGNEIEQLDQLLEKFRG